MLGKSQQEFVKHSDHQEPHSESLKSSIFPILMLTVKPQQVVVSASVRLNASVLHWLAVCINKQVKIDHNKLSNEWICFTQYRKDSLFGLSKACIMIVLWAVWSQTVTRQQLHSGSTPSPSPSSALCVLVPLFKRFWLLCSHLPRRTPPREKTNQHFSSTERNRGKAKAPIEHVFWNILKQTWKQRKWLFKNWQTTAAAEQQLEHSSWAGTLLSKQLKLGSTLPY